MNHKRYYEDIKLGEMYRSGTYHLSEQAIIDFARQWDPQQVHIDPEFAAQTKFGNVFASATHLVSITTKLSNSAWGSIALSAGLGWDKVRFISPGLPGANLYSEAEVISKRESGSNPDAGIVTWAMRLFNQHDEPVIAYEAIGLIEKYHKQ
ncbi:MAG: MaoC/PaaZ C-terminal domain-containing protein [Dehalococcoidia bacterium]|nr:MaoC/PaaZ C-terminal domain-containing protein [Dehalococcoidia bacterium]